MAQSNYFAPESDNVKAYKNISNFVITPIIGHDGKPNGVLQLYCFKQQINRMLVKKMVAMRKFVGGCLDTINLMNQNLETVVGAMSMVRQSMLAVIEREKEAEKDHRLLIELEQNVKASSKEITSWFTRAMNEPGFVPPVIEEETNYASKKLPEQRAGEEAAELAKKRET